MVRALFILIPVVAAFWIFTIVDCAVQPPTRHRGVSKPAWIAIVVLIPVLGGILWLAVGRVRRSAVRVYQAPDDDPEFLGRLGAVSDQDERIRRLEEELALLDSEDDDPRWQQPPTIGGTADPTTEPPASDGDDDSLGQRGAVG
ncbi:PLD nuclease N-terminal domain-containing protein [Microbacterium sp. NPDC055910]|uniref:PLD nuclease N-terminal domain-containing protein n=1 Tax=Microbacterium sp. NPDC055910 TaxID=3345659 RepID=UPI0035E072B9